MMRPLFLYVVFIVVFPCTNPLRLSPKITNGHAPTFQTLSFSASLINAFSTTCTATLIAPHHLLTARHCTPTNASFLFLSGDTLLSGALLPVESVHPYPGSDAADDMTIIRVKTAASGRKFVKLNTNADLPKEGSVVKAVGYGRVVFAGGGVGVLREVEMGVVGREVCGGVYEGVDERWICAGERGRGSCGGDSGGGLVMENENGEVVLYGITSRGVGCGWEGKWGVYVNIERYLEWIEGVLKEWGETVDKN